MNEEHNIMATFIIKALQRDKAVISFGRLNELLINNSDVMTKLKEYDIKQIGWAFENVLTMLQSDYALLRIEGQRASENRSFELTAKGYSVRLCPDFNGYLLKTKLYRALNKGVPWIASAVALFISCESLIKNGLNWPTYIFMLISLLFGIVIGYELKQRI